MNKVYKILTLSFFLSFCFLNENDNKDFKEKESLKKFLNGCWKRIESTYFGETYIDSDVIYNLYTIYDDTSSVFYSFRYIDKNQSVLENHLISFINYNNIGIKKYKGKVVLGFEGWYSNEITWKDLVESNQKEVFPIIRLSDNKFKIIFPGKDYNNEEIYIRLNKHDFPDYLKETLLNE